MNDKDWEQFAELLQKIVALPGSWVERKATLSDKLDELGAKQNFAEIVSWYLESEHDDEDWDDEDWDDDDEEDWDDDDMDG